MNKTVLKVQTKKSSLKPSAIQKRDAMPFTDKIPFIRSLILDSVEPGAVKKIYLFGSYAYGMPTKDSDIDICVVIRNDLNRSDVSKKIALSLFNNDIVPVDLMIYREEIFYDISNPNGIENTILTKGKILYE
jgi:predicted nucleotidyltransferase